MSRQIQFLSHSILLSSLFSLVCITSAVAQQDRLTDAEVFRLQNSVQLLLRNQSPRPARLADVLRPLDSLRTARASIAELLFNEGSIARVDQNTTFRFETGMRRFQLRNRIAMNETIFILENGTVLIMSPPGSVATQVRTPDSVITIATASSTANLPREEAIALSSTASPKNLPLLVQATPAPQANPAPTENLLAPPEDSSVVMVTYDAARGATQVFALTDGDISVSDLQGNRSVSLQGGQTVAVIGGEVGRVQEFDLQTFYRSVALAAGLGPGQEAIVAEQPPSVQPTLNVVRIETLAAIRNQERREESFSATFLQDALSGSDADFDGFRGRRTVTIINPQVTLGTFVRTGETTAVFTDAQGNQTPISVDFDDQTIAINGRTGISNNAGLSGNNASGTVIFPNGRAIRIDVFGVNGDEPPENVPFRGSLTTGIAPDR